MGKGYNNYMTKKFFHPGSKENIKRTWMAEQKAVFDKKKQEEMLGQYHREQEMYANRALLGDEKAKVGLSFMYDAPPGAKQEKEKEDDEPEYKFEWQRKFNAPRESYAKGNEEIRDQPFGIEVRNVRCIKCHKWGHVNTDKICPLFARDLTAEPPQPGQSHTEIVDQMKGDGLKIKDTLFGKKLNPKDPKDQLVQSDNESGDDPEVQFLKSLTPKQKKKLLKKLDKLARGEDEGSSGKKKKQKKEKKSKKRDTDDSSDNPDHKDVHPNSQHRKMYDPRGRADAKEISQPVRGRSDDGNDPRRGDSRIPHKNHTDKSKRQHEYSHTSQRKDGQSHNSRPSDRGVRPGIKRSMSSDDEKTAASRSTYKKHDSKQTVLSTHADKNHFSGSRVSPTQRAPSPKVRKRDYSPKSPPVSNDRASNGGRSRLPKAHSPVSQRPDRDRKIEKTPPPGKHGYHRRSLSTPPDSPTISKQMRTSAEKSKMHGSGVSSKDKGQIVIRRQRSRSPSPSFRRQRSRSPSPTIRHQKPRSPSAGFRRQRSRSPSPTIRQKKQRSPSPGFRRQRSRSPSTGLRRRKSKSYSPVLRRRRSRSPSTGLRRHRSRSHSPGLRRRGSRSPSIGVRRRRSRSYSPDLKRRGSRSPSPRFRSGRSRSPLNIRRRSSRSPSPRLRRRGSRSFSPSFRRRRSKSSSTRLRLQRSRSTSRFRGRGSRSPSPGFKYRRSTSYSPGTRRRSRSTSGFRRRRSRSYSPAFRRKRSRSSSRISRSSSSSLRRRTSRSPPLRRSPVIYKKFRGSPGRRSRSRCLSPRYRRGTRSPSPRYPRTSLYRRGSYRSRSPR